MKSFTKLRSYKKLVSSAFAFSLIFSFQACNGPEEVSPQDTAQAVVLSEAQGGTYIEGRYIVVLREDKVPLRPNLTESFYQRRERARGLYQEVLKDKEIPAQAMYSVYGAALTGFAAELTPAQVKALQTDPRVAYIEKDQVVSLVRPVKEENVTSTSTQTVPIGITRVGGGTETYTGTKKAYVIDTGILLFTNSAGELIVHPDLNVETTREKMYNAFCDDIVDGKPVTCTGTDRYPNDGNGHGTHVAGTIGAKLNTEGVVGVVPNVTLVAVKVLGTNGSGTLTNVLEGLDFVHYDGTSGDVANMSLGAAASTTLDNAVIKVADKGVLFAIAAGNDGMPAGNYSPARVHHNNVFTIAAMSTKKTSTGWSDSWASFSNHGQPPVDFISVGANVNSTYVRVETHADGTKSYHPAYATLSGTSMAAPHVAGLLLLNGTDIKTNGLVKRNNRDVYNVAHRYSR